MRCGSTGTCTPHSHARTHTHALHCTRTKTPIDTLRCVFTVLCCFAAGSAFGCDAAAFGAAMLLLRRIVVVRAFVMLTDEKPIHDCAVCKRSGPQTTWPPCYCASTRARAVLCAPTSAPNVDDPCAHVRSVRAVRSTVCCAPRAHSLGSSLAFGRLGSLDRLRCVRRTHGWRPGECAAAVRGSPA